MVLSKDELFELLSWLPAKAIYKLASTCKFFSKFPEETCFASKQAQNALIRDDTCFFIQPDIIHWYQTELHPLPGEEFSSGVSNDVMQFLSNSVNILSSSNGLILFIVTTHAKVKLYICNPATKSFLSIPTPEHMQNSGYTIINIDFQCDSDGGFKLFHFYPSSDNWFSYFNCYVYESKEGVWKVRKERFFTGSSNMKFDMPVHHNGAIHFISNCASSIKGNSPYFLPYIMSYNFEDGKSRMLRVPKEANMSSHDRDMGIFKWGKVGKHSNQSICLVKLRKHVFTVWVLVNYESSLWKKVFDMKVVSKENDLIVRGFAVLNGDLLVFATEKKVYGIGLTDMMIQEICQHKCECNFLRFISYSDTLRTCGIGAETLPLSSHI